MSIPTTITSLLADLQAEVAAATPLTSASQQTLVAIQLNAEQLLDEIATALPAAAGQLDTFVAPAQPQAIATGILGLLESAQDQANLANWQGYFGRAAINLDQLTP
jgi:hypothetical protein